MEKKPVTDAQTFSAERFTKQFLYKKGGSNVFVLNFSPGQELPPHKHPGHELFILVLEGGGTMTVNGEPIAVTQGDTVYCESEELFSFQNTGDRNTSLYVVLSKTAM